MKRILYIPSSMNGGVYYYRCLSPMREIVKMFPDEFDITIDNHWTFTDDQKDEIGKSFDIVWIHQGLYTSKFQEEFWKMIVYCKKEYNTTFILDLDDYWEYHKQHPAYDACIFNAFPEKMMINFNMFDFITTTTEYFKSVISKYFQCKEKIFVFENAISKDDTQFTKEKNISDKLRVGLTGGSSHTEDIKQILEFSKYLNEKQLDQIEFVFCGFDNKNAEKVIIDEQGNIIDRIKLDDKDNWWVQTENIFKSRIKNYKRIETKNIIKNEFGQIYKDIDVLLVPLINNKFNRCKSELKFIEAGFTDTAVISSKVIPYSNFGTNNVDCLFVKENEPQYWAKEIKKLLINKELLEKLKFNLNQKVEEIRNLKDITIKRVEFLRKI